MLKAIKAQLETGSIKTVFVRGTGQQYPAFDGDNLLPMSYIILYEGEEIIRLDGSDNTVEEIFIEVHFPQGHVQELNNYIREECVRLLHRVRLTTDDANVFRLDLTNRISPMVEENDNRALTGGNDDRTISKSRVFLAPVKWR